MKYSDVFVPGGFPHHTYNPRVERNLEARIDEVSDNLCKLVTVTGHTKSGKTVLVRSKFPRSEAIWVDGGSVSYEEDFWSIIIEQLNLFQSHSEEEILEDTVENGIEGGGGLNGLVAKAEAKVSLREIEKNSETKSKTRNATSRTTALRGLSESKIPLIVDDFHYIPRELQGSLVRALKALIFDGLPVVLIAIPHRRYDALKVEKEMTGRLHPVEIPLWGTEELLFIPKTGFPLLACKVPSTVENTFATEAIGSPHLIQDFCRTLCRKYGIRTEDDGTNIVPTPADLREIYSDVAETIGRPIFEKLARGPRQRTDRILRSLKDGTELDIYGLVLRALAHLKPGLVTIEYEELRSAIREISDDVPQLHEVARVLRHMATIAASDESSTPVIDFEEEEKILHITDPFFAFFLRWGDLSTQ